MSKPKPKPEPIRMDDWLGELLAAQEAEIGINAPPHAVTLQEVIARTGMARTTAKNRMERDVKRGKLVGGWRRGVDSLGRSTKERAYWPAEG